MRQPDGCMKQIHSAMGRATGGQKPLQSSKWKAFLDWNQPGQTYFLHLYHYQHLILVYDLWGRKLLYEWHEKPADKRGLDSAKAWLKAYHEDVDLRISKAKENSNET